MSKLQNFLSILRAKWEDLLNIEAAITEPGFIGPVPYLLFLRWLILLGIFLRFMLHRNEYSGGQWILILSLIGVTGLLAFTATYLTAHTTLRRSKRIRSLLVAADILLISFFYYLTRTVQSDFFLFYFLPIFIATEYLSGRAMLVVPVTITGAFAGVICLLFLKFPEPDSTLLDLFLRVFLPREVFFLSVAFLSLYLRQLERIQREKVSQREREIQTLLEFKADVDQLFDLGQILGLTIRKAVSILRCEGGHISLINYETNQLELRAHAPEDYFAKEPMLTVDDDIAKQVVNQRKSLRLEGVQSDPALRTAFQPDICAVLYVPIIAHNTVLGTLCVGARKKKHFGNDEERLLSALSGQAASAIERARLLTSLSRISGAPASSLALDLTLDSILQELTETLGFEFATVSLVDEYRRTIEMVRGKNVPAGWIKRSRYSLDQTDILTDVVSTGKTEVIQGWDNRFNREIYDRFGHEHFTRIFAPLRANGKIVGTIEAGCRSEKRADIISPEKIQAVEQLGRGRGQEIARTRPFVLLEMIADQAIKIIGADSASIHVYYFGELLLEASAGRADKDFLRKFPPRKEGIGRKAMRTGEYRVIDDPEVLAAANEKLYDKGVRAIAAFPLDAGACVRGVLYVHFWREHEFSQAELELEEAFAQQMVSAIQTNLLLKSMSEATERAWTLSGFQNVIHSLASTLDLTQVLDDIAQNLLVMLDADNVTLYQFFEVEQRFGVPPVMRGKFRDQSSMVTQIAPDAVVWKVVRGGRSRFITNALNEPMLSTTSKDNFNGPRFVEREGIRSCAAVVLRTEETDEIAGLMFVNYCTPRSFGVEDQKTINALASSAAIAIKTARLHDRVSQDLQRRDKELDALRAVDQAIVAGPRVPELQQVLKFILDKGVEIIGAPLGEIFWYNRWENVLESRVERDVPEGCRTIRQNIGEGIVGLAARRKESVLAHDVTTEEWAGVCKDAIPGTRSELAVPLVDESGLLGVLNLKHPEVGAFSEDDQALMETLALQAIIAIHSVELNRKLERQVKCLRSLSIIATRIQDARYELDTVLRLLLTGVTAGEGLGFSRAMLFLTDDTGTRLQGKMAIGEQTREGAEATWERLDEDADSLRARGEDVLTSLLDQAEEFSIAVREGRERDWPLSTAVQSISIPIEESGGALSVCMLEGKSIIVKDAQPDPFRKIIEQISQPDDTGRAFACAPLVGKEGVIGTLVADNRFLLGEREIEEEKISSLEAFAGVTAMSIENARLQERLTEERRQATWEEFTVRVAHTMSTRVGAIEGWIKVLYSRLILTVR
jgi:GAF domain-containing protein